MRIVPEEVEEKPFTVETLNLSRVEHRVKSAFGANAYFHLIKNFLSNFRTTWLSLNLDEYEENRMKLAAHFIADNFSKFCI